VAHRLRVISFLAVIALLAGLTLPKVDVPQTRFDEANTPTNEILLQRAVPSREQTQFREQTQLGTASVARLLADAHEICPRMKPAVSVGQLSDSRTHLEILCTFLC
jgi:hypothetical protein